MTELYFQGRKCKRGHTKRYVQNNRCVVCHAERNKRYVEANREKVKARIKQWRYLNLEHDRVTSRAWRRNNPDKAKATTKRWQDSHKERRSELSKAWRVANLSRKKATDLAWRVNNKDKVRISWKRRRARKRGAEGKFFESDVKAMLQKQGHKCLGCGWSFFLVPYTVDHVLALARGGTNWPNNLQLLCQMCNDAKGVKTNEEWRAAA